MTAAQLDPLPITATGFTSGNETNITTTDNTYIVYYVPNNKTVSTIKEKTQLDASGWAGLATTALGTIQFTNASGYESTYKVFRGPLMMANTGTYKIE
jgi:hypothetical protein